MPTHSTPKPRTARSRKEILDAAFELAMAHGYAKLTMEGVAARARVGKQTIYRWWPSKAALALDVLNDRIGATTDFPDTGDIAADLTTQITAVANLFNSPMAPIFRGVIADAQSDLRVAEAVAATFLGPRADACATRLDRAVAAGQIRDDIPTADMVELLYGPLYYRVLLRGLTLTTDHAITALHSVLEGLARKPNPA
ncbi:TetR/AcrR family transcriptional regulator [Nocardia huaxiensis]|uniref:TetR/AcrR family transcriptional regulator n=1 Tax=Nocardia huaxiensis TaxID=2755382 RepID=A0A7D6VBP6_9NOCA|nr:TetR/AcrR family transcriptional regulator [Nocardia huaxiensis]QLY28435.1 TetR/AcrR family transcriptional regulator [Nocardia huaxiensis]UFS98116.1 TetR/AcrR family transcriptional regulator [Nocardia huaxiensis]